MSIIYDGSLYYKSKHLLPPRYDKCSYSPEIYLFIKKSVAWRRQVLAL